MDRRKHYRIIPPDHPDLRLTVAKAGRKPVSADLLDISAGGVMVQIALPNGPDLVLGEDVKLGFMCAQLRKPLDVLARVAHRIHKDDDLRYGLTFIDTEHLERCLPEALFWLFNRRGLPRIHPDPATPIEITLEALPDGGRRPGRMVDLSATGVGVGITGELAPDVRRVRVTFPLPNRREPVQIEGIVRSCRPLSGDEVRYGIAFVLDPSKPLEDQHAAIIDFVTQRGQMLTESLRAG